jgi:hypothetical protein
MSPRIKKIVSSWLTSLIDTPESIQSMPKHVLGIEVYERYMLETNAESGITFLSSVNIGAFFGHRGWYHERLVFLI